MVAISQAVSIVGGQVAMSRLLDVTPQAVNQWVRGKRPVSPRLALKIEEITDGQVTRYQLRPDVFGPPPGEPRQAA